MTDTVQRPSSKVPVDMEVQNLRSHCNSSSLVLDSVRHRKSVQLNQQRVRNMFMIGCCANEIELHSS